MSADDGEIPEENISTVISLQQSHYQHVQSMAATFLSILLTLVIALGGLVSAGLVSVQPPEVPSDVESFNMSIIGFVELSISQDSIEMLVDTGMGYSLFYFAAGFFIILVACSKLLSCLEIEVFHPNESIRGVDELSVISDSGPVERIKTNWVIDNSDLNSRIDQKFRSAQFHLVLGAFLILYATLRILLASDLLIVFLLLFVCGLPIFLLSVLIYYPYVFSKDVFHFYFSDNIPEDQNSIESQSRFLSAIYEVVLAWSRHFNLTERFDHHPIVYLFYIACVFMLIIPLIADSAVFSNIVFSILF